VESVFTDALAAGLHVSGASLRLTFGTAVAMIV
jgi:hypothetical protein